MPPGTSLQDGQRQIPGFYYDNAKRRYFKIAHTASGGAYTASSIAKRTKIEKQIEIEKEQAERIARFQASRKRLTLPCASMLLLNRALGLREAPSHQQVWSSSFHKDSICSRLLSTAGYRTKIAYNADMNELYMASGRFIEAHNMNTDAELPSNIAQDSYIRRIMPISPLRSAASSLVFSNGTLLGTSVGEGDKPAEVIIRNQYGGKISTVDGTIWCSAVQTGSNYFAAAGSKLLLYDVVGFEEIRREAKITGKMDVMAMDFLDANVIALGCRNGVVQLYDVRSNNPATMPRFRHAHGKAAGVVSMKSLHNQAIVISGLQNSLNMYDLRFMKNDRAFVQYSNHKNEYDMNVNAMAIGGNILAVAQATSGFNLYGLDGKFLTTKSTKNQIDDLCFPKSWKNEHDILWTVSRSRLDQWSFDP